MAEAYYQFEQAARGRQEVHDAIAQLDPPASVADEHAKVVGVLADGSCGGGSAGRGDAGSGEAGGLTHAPHTGAEAPGCSEATTS